MLRITQFIVVVFSIAIAGVLSTPVVAQETGAKAKQDAKQESDEQKETDDKTEAKQPEPFPITVADGKVKFAAPGNWKSIPPKSNIVEAEVKVPRVGKDTEDGRLTIMGAGGSIEANILRWYDQFKQPDGSATKDKAKVSKTTIAGQTVHMVDISGNFMAGMGGPFAPKTEKPNQRMLAAIIQTQGNGNYFVKLTGPADTIAKNAKGFKSMLESLEVSK